MKNMLIAGFALAMSFGAFTACKHDSSKHNHPHTGTADANAKYICPMNCEKGKTYDKPGSCPVCHMDLTLMKTEVPKTEYYIDYSANPADLALGKEAVLSFTPKQKDNASALVPLDLVHEKKMHLILVSDDLSWFDHVHPTYTVSGTYDLKMLGKTDQFANGRGHDESRFETGGNYWAFADFKPTGGLNQVEKIALAVAGPQGKPMTFDQPKWTAKTDDYTLKINAPERIKMGEASVLPVEVSQNGKALDPAAFENYLGEKAHVIMVETATKAFVHTHPSVEEGKLVIRTTFAQPGLYRAWLQFQTAGKVRTAGFVLKVE